MKIKMKRRISHSAERRRRCCDSLVLVTYRRQYENLRGFEMSLSWFWTLTQQVRFHVHHLVSKPKTKCPSSHCVYSAHRHMYI